MITSARAGRELHAEAQADRTTPVVDDERRVAQAELLEELTHARVAVVGVPAEAGGLVRAPEAREVRRMQRWPAACTGGITLR